MSPATPAPDKPRRSWWWWLTLGIGLMLTPLVVLGIGAISLLTLDRDAATLRREVMAASEAKWHTKVQMSLGWVTLGAVRTGLRFIQAEHRDEARLALQAVRRASVGVYECDARNTSVRPGELLGRTDKLMHRRGWSRLVGVREDKQTVLVYVSDDIGSGSEIDLCVAVVEGKQLVVVSTKVAADALFELAERHMPKGGLKGKLKLAKL